MEPIFKAGEQSPDDPMEFVMSTDTSDRVGDVILQDGWDLRSFKKNPVALWGHNSQYPIGAWSNLRVEAMGKKQALIGRLTLAKAGTSRFIDELRSLIEQRILRAVSVGFRPTETEPVRDKDGYLQGFRFLKAELLECSLVSVPANPDAISLAKGLNLSEDILTTAFAASGFTLRETMDRSEPPPKFRLQGASAQKAKLAVARATRILEK
jgi:HK97 family phage prohead protease